MPNNYDNTCNLNTNEWSFGSNEWGHSSSYTLNTDSYVSDENKKRLVDVSNWKENDIVICISEDGLCPLASNHFITLWKSYYILKIETYRFFINNVEYNRNPIINDDRGESMSALYGTFIRINKDLFSVGQSIFDIRGDKGIITKIENDKIYALWEKHNNRELFVYLEDIDFKELYLKNKELNNE